MRREKFTRALFLKVFLFFKVVQSFVSFSVKKRPLPPPLIVTEKSETNPIYRPFARQNNRKLLRSDIKIGPFRNLE
jgi:hypothetical protein